MKRKERPAGQEKGGDEETLIDIESERQRQRAVKRQAEFWVKERGLRGKGGEELENYFLSYMNKQHISLEHSIL